MIGVDDQRPAGRPAGRAGWPSSGCSPGILIFLPIGGAELQIVPAFWMVMMGILLCRALARRRAAGVGPPRMGRRPWPSRGPPARRVARARCRRRGAPAPTRRGGLAPAPARPARPGAARLCGKRRSQARPGAAQWSAQTADARARRWTQRARAAARGRALPAPGSRSASRPAERRRPSTSRPRRDPQGWWAAQAERLDWFQKYSRVLDDDEPALLQVVRRRLAERLLQLPRPPCDRGQRRARRAALARRGRQRARRSPTPQLLAEVERLASALKDLGVDAGDVVGHLPADDPGGRRLDARLCAHRRAPQRRLRWLLRRGRPRAHGVLPGEGADHGRRRRAQGQDRRRQGPRGRGDGRPDDAREDRRRAEQGHAMRDAAGPRCLLRRRYSPPPTRHARPSRSTPSTRCSSSTPPARPPSRRGSCTPPAATSRASRPRTRSCSTSSRRATCTGAPPTSAGSRGIPTSSTGRCATARRSVMWEGAPDYPDPGVWWELVERYRVSILYCAPTAIRACMKWGARVAQRARPRRRCGCSARSASRSTPRRGSGTTR